MAVQRLNWVCQSAVPSLFAGRNLLSMEPQEKEDLERWDRQHVWHAFTQMAEYEPLIIERALGCTLYDIDGNAYLDGGSSMWCNVHGHRHPWLDAALRRQLDHVAHVTSLGMSNPTTIRLAKRLVELCRTDCASVFFLRRRGHGG